MNIFVSISPIWLKICKKWDIDATNRLTSPKKQKNTLMQLNSEVDLGLLQHPRWSSPRSTSGIDKKCNFVT